MSQHHRDAVYGASLQSQYSSAVRLWYSLVRIRDRESVLNCESLDHRLRVTLLIGFNRRYLTIPSNVTSQAVRDLPLLLNDEA